LINVSSMVSKIGQPYTSAYVSSKFAITGLSECLRMELMDAPDIHVGTILPASIDTPIFQHAANYTGRAVKAMTPVYPALQVAEAIVEMAESPHREVFVGNAGRMLNALHTIAPGFAERQMAQQVEADHLADRPAEPSPGNLFEPSERHAGISGGWMTENRSNRNQGMLLGLGALGIGLGLAAFLLVDSDRRHRTQAALRETARTARREGRDALQQASTSARSLRRSLSSLVS
jgi:hypothetical protein